MSRRRGHEGSFLHMVALLIWRFFAGVVTAPPVRKWQGLRMVEVVGQCKIIETQVCLLSRQKVNRAWVEHDKVLTAFPQTCEDLAWHVNT